jgi:hypothetical protein
MRRRALARRALRLGLGLAGALVACAALVGCSTVRPQARSVLADPIMQFEQGGMATRQREHAHENREGAAGGGPATGGGCGCN